MFGLLIYLPTIAYIPHYTYILSLIYLLVKYNKIIFTQKYISSKININVLIILLIIALSILNRIFFINNFKNIQDDFPFVLLVLLTYYIGIKIEKNELKILIFLIVIESLIVVYVYGVSTFFKKLDFYTEFNTDSDLLYFSRPLGLSENSSHIAQKILLAFLLIDFLKLKDFIFQLIKIVFIISLTMTFNRTAMLVLVLYLAMKSIPYIIKITKEISNFIMSRKLFFIFIIYSIGSLFLIYVIYKYHNIIFIQYSRSYKSIDLSGREIIWPKFINFIKENWLLGNGSYKYFVDYHGNQSQAHNSFLQLIATNGIIISILYVILIIRNITFKNFIYIIAILLFSVFQYGIIWGF